MASVYKYLDESGVRKLTEYILSYVNKKLSAHVIQDPNDESAYEDDQTLLSAKAVLDLVGQEGSDDSSLYGKAEWIEDMVGSPDDDSSKQTLYGSLRRAYETLLANIESLNTLRYKVVRGTLERYFIQGRVPDKHTLYLQQDSATDIAFKLYVWNGSDSDTDYSAESGKWICVGDITLDLAGYWRKDMKSLLELRDDIMEILTKDEIAQIVSNAFKLVDDNTGAWVWPEIK